MQIIVRRGYQCDSRESQILLDVSGAETVQSVLTKTLVSIQRMAALMFEIRDYL